MLVQLIKHIAALSCFNNLSTVCIDIFSESGTFFIISSLDTLG